MGENNKEFANKIENAHSFSVSEKNKKEYLNARSQLKSSSSVSKNIAKIFSKNSKIIQNEKSERSIESLENLTQELFSELAFKIKSNNSSFSILFLPFCKKIKIENIDTPYILKSDFIKGLAKLNLSNLTDLQKSCYFNPLSFEDRDDFLSVIDLIQILLEFEISDNDSQKILNDYLKEMCFDFNALDKESFAFFYLLSEMFQKSDSSLNIFFENKFQRVNDTLVGNLVIINSKDFFKIIADKGIISDNSTQNQIKELLRISPNLEDQISKRKLEYAFKEFATNVELNKKAKDFYEEIIKKEDYIDEIDDNLLKQSESKENMNNEVLIK